MGFYPESKTWYSDHTQTSRQAFLANFLGVLLLKNAILGLTGTQENVSLIVLKVGVTRNYASENEEQHGGFVGEIFKE